MKKELDNVTKKALELLDSLERCKTELKIENKDGYVCINKSTHDFTYFGKFGQLCLNMNITHNCMNALDRKFLILAANMEAYSMKVAGNVILSM